MDFFINNYSYFIFISAWAYLLFAISCFAAHRVKLIHLSYFWLILFSLCFATLNFLEMLLLNFNSDNIVKPIVFNIFFCMGMVFFFISAEDIFNKMFNKAYINYLVIILSIITLPVLLYFGVRQFKSVLFFCLFTPGALLIIISIYKYYKKSSYQKKTVFTILIAFIVYATLIHFLQILKCLNIQSFSISIVQLVIALALFLIASLFFKYARIKKADIAKVYNYVPYYWKYLQLMSILILIGLFLTDLLFSNYLNKLNIPPIVKNISLFETSVVIILILIIFWVADKLTITFTLAFQHKVILDSVKSIIIFSTSLDGDVIIYGKGAEDITGYKLEELIQEERLDKIFFDKNKNPINFKSEIKGLLSKSLEWVCVRKDGYPITVLMYIVPQLSLDGKHIGYIFSGVDISDTKKAEAALKRQLIFLQKLIDNIPVAIYYKGSDMRMIGCNKVFEELLEHSKEEIVGASAKDIYYDENAGDVSQKTDVQILKGLSSISYEITLNTKKANPKNIIFYKTAFKTLSGKFRGIIGVLIDVTKERKVRDERDKLQISLMQQNKLASLGELSGSIAHELNNPLTIILGYTQVLMRDKTLNNETAKAIKNIYDAAQRSHNIIKNMLGFARTDSLKVQEIDINNIVEQTLFIVEKDFYKSNIEIVKNLTDQSVFVLVNPMQIQQVILNIMLNAKDAMPDGGKLTITTTVEKDKYMLSLKDTGMGIEKGNIAKVFDPFFTTKEVGKGTGLGLSICYGIIKGLKGKISVESTVGKGTVFYIDFPLKKI